MPNDIKRECENALDKIDLLHLLSQYGHFVKVEGSLVGPCPFPPFPHERRDTLDVKFESKEFHCISPKCDRRGTIIELIAAFEKSDIDSACTKILRFSITEQELIQDAMPFVGLSADQKKLPEYTQTPLRKLRQCSLRYWYEYIRKDEQDSKQPKGTYRDKQTIESTLGSLIHSALKRFYNLPETTRQLRDLTAIFMKLWGKGYGSPDEREYWLEKAHTALQNAYEMNVHFNPIKVETEGSRSIVFPFDIPLYRLKSTADRIDWFSETEYNLIDYKWDERPQSEKEAAADFQTVIYYLSWTGSQRGIPPKVISYQYLSYGIQKDVIPTVPTMEPGIEILLEYIEKAEKAKSQTTEPEATINEYCNNCKLYGKCPATKQQIK